MRVTRLEVDLNKFLDNISCIREYVNDKELIPVIKANGYGTYINKKIDILNRFKIVAVAIVNEGVEIRKQGFMGDILILNQPYYGEIDLIEKYNLTVGISDEDFLYNCILNNNKINVHLEIETGMNRTGISIKSLPSFLNKISTSLINVSGVYTHFSSADVDSDYTNMQIDIFRKALDIIKKYNFNLKYIHTSASNGLLNYKLDFTNSVRPGIIMYGYESFKGVLEIIPIKGICQLMSKITFLKEIDANQSIGYSRSYVSDKKMIIATIPIGYADGLPRKLSNSGYVYINGYRANIVGKVCMDSIMVDVTNIPNVSLYDDVEIFGDKISLDEFANMCDTINYEALSTIQDRVERCFVGGEKYE